MHKNSQNLNKAALRAHMRGVLKQLPRAVYELQGEQVAKHLRLYVKKTSCKGVALFESFLDEIDTKPIICELTLLKVPYFLNLDFDPECVSLILAPGLAFDLSGGRLGRGKGVYDRFLENLEPNLPFCVGLCLDEQILPKVPMDIWDKRVHGLLTAQKGFVKTTPCF